MDGVTDGGLVGVKDATEGAIEGVIGNDVDDSMDGMNIGATDASQTAQP